MSYATADKIRQLEAPNGPLQQTTYRGVELRKGTSDRRQRQGARKVRQEWSKAVLQQKPLALRILDHLKDVQLPPKPCHSLQHQSPQVRVRVRVRVRVLASIINVHSYTVKPTVATYKHIHSYKHHISMDPIQQ